MRYLILILFCSSAFAGNFVPASKAPTKTYWDKAACETQEGGECIDTTGCPLDECSIQNVGGKKQAVRDAAKLKEINDKNKGAAKKAKDRDDRLARIATGCAQAEGLVKELCDHILDK